jgi:hypothetical protein
MRCSVIPLLLLAAGCPPRQPPREPFAALPPRDAAALVNENAAKISGAIRAVGAADGFVLDNGGRARTYHLDGTLIYLSPRCLRFDLKSFGERKLLVGSNPDQFWYFDAQDDRFRCGRHDEPEEFDEPLPVRPAQLIESLGLTPIPDPSFRGAGVGLAQRIQREGQQILFLAEAADGALRVEKEYWLDGYGPRLVRGVIFRDEWGEANVEAFQDDYRRLGPDGPWLPHQVTVVWRRPPARLCFRVQQWTYAEGLTVDSLAFVAPRECRAND